VVGLRAMDSHCLGLCGRTSGSGAHVLVSDVGARRC
jgi:hypothetical protein